MGMLGADAFNFALLCRMSKLISNDLHNQNKRSPEMAKPRIEYVNGKNKQ